MVDEGRVHELNNEPIGPGRYVLYWMQASQRADWNPALDYAIAEANRIGLPVVCLFGLMDGYPDSNIRHFEFMIQGLEETSRVLESRGIRFVCIRKNPPEAVEMLCADAAQIVCDAGYLHIQRQWRASVASTCSKRVCEVEGDVVVPVREAYGKESWSAAVLRPRIARAMDRYLADRTPVLPRRDSLGLPVGSAGVGAWGRVLADLDTDRSIPPSTVFRGGSSVAESRLSAFLSEKLPLYAEKRNDPSLSIQSCLSPYLHFGQISPVYVARRVREEGSAPPAARDAFLEELIVRRELAVNYAFYNPSYETYAGVSEWARATLAEHRRDKRPVSYGSEDFERAATHDRYWNAAMREMIVTGFMHNYMRMYWGKKIVEWTEDPEQAFAMIVRLNNRYFLDGRDPNSYAGAAWIFGKHDRPWTERPVFGKVRYMNEAGLRRKFDIDAYASAMESLPASEAISSSSEPTSAKAPSRGRSPRA